MIHRCKFVRDAGSELGEWGLLGAGYSTVVQASEITALKLSSRLLLDRVW